jgi:septal ring factor EnvC (AmiA/AmiB activator)
MKQLGSSLLRFKEFNHANYRIASERLLFWLVLTLLAGLCGCKSSTPTPIASSKGADPVQTEIAALAAAIADLRNQNDNLRRQEAGLHDQSSDLWNQNAQLRKALETALEAQEQLTNQVHQLNDELRSARDDLTLVREQLHDLELERETKPVEPTSGTMTAQKPQ